MRRLRAPPRQYGSKPPDISVGFQCRSAAIAEVCGTKTSPIPHPSFHCPARYFRETVNINSRFTDVPRGSRRYLWLTLTQAQQSRTLPQTRESELARYTSMRGALISGTEPAA